MASWYLGLYRFAIRGLLFSLFGVFSYVFELACRGIITIDDLADQSIDELMPIKDMTEEIAGKLIMTARAPMFEGVK